MSRLILAAVCFGVAFSGATTFGQYVVTGPVPVAVYRQVPVVAPVAPVFQPVVPALAPVVAYRPAFASDPVVYGPAVPYGPPVPYGATVAYGPAMVPSAPAIGYAWPTVVVQPRFYVPGQPVRNVIRAVAP